MVDRDPSEQGVQREIVTLSGEDAAVLDALLQTRGQGATTGPLPADSAERAQRLTALLDLLEQDPVEPAPDDLTQRTLARLQAMRQQRRFAQQVEMLREPRRSLGVDWRQLLSAAAIFLVACSLIAPVLSRTRADARRIACAGNLATAGMAFGAYANDHAGVLPRGASRPGALWWNVGQPNQTQPRQGDVVTSNSAHLFLLVRLHYADAATLACPANAHAARAHLDPDAHDWPTPQAVSFSYQNQYTPEPIPMDGEHIRALLADRNPLFIARAGRVTFNPDASPLSSSRSHDQRGQNVLTSDGRVHWTIRPMITRGGAGEADNIWVISGVTRYTGREVPTRGDGFLVP